MAGYSCSLTPDEGANMYYRGRWEYCPEYKVGDVVLCGGELYLCVSPHAGKDPAEKTNKDYWQKFGYVTTPTEPPSGKIILDGGYATTQADDTFTASYPAVAVNGGSSSERVNVPLV